MYGLVRGLGDRSTTAAYCLTSLTSASSNDTSVLLVRLSDSRLARSSWTMSRMTLALRLRVSSLGMNLAHVLISEYEMTGVPSWDLHIKHQLRHSPRDGSLEQR